MMDTDKRSVAILTADGEKLPAIKSYTTPALRVYGTLSALTLSGGTRGTEGQSGKSRLGSDPALKENIVRVGTHPRGFGVYLFDYRPPYRDIWGHGRQFGVMADEVEPVIPEAVSTGEDGFKRVDYGMLGIGFPTR